MRKTGLMLLCGLFLFTVVGCGMVKGLGNDISAVGHWFSKGSDKVKEGPAQ